MITYCIAQGLHSVLCGDLSGKEIQKKRSYMHTYNGFTLLYTWNQHSTAQNCTPVNISKTKKSITLTKKQRTTLAEKKWPWFNG